MTEQNAILISLLAAVDAVYLPDRKPMDHHRHATIHERRAEYPAVGIALVTLAGPGATEADRKAAGRALVALERAGLLTRHKPKWARATSLRLTEKGDRRARAVAGLLGIDDALPLLDRLHTLRTDPRCHDEQGACWISEWVLADRRPGQVATEDDRAELHVQQMQLLPLLVRGLVDSNCTARGDVWYALTPDGVALAERRAAGEKPKARAKLPKASAAAEDFYYERIADELSRLQTTPPRQPQEIGQLPLPVSPRNPRPGFAQAWQQFAGAADRGEAAGDRAEVSQ